MSINAPLPATGTNDNDDTNQPVDALGHISSKPLYERPTLTPGGQFRQKTWGASGSLAFDYYITDYP